MSYNDKVLDHYENPRNVGTLDKDDPHVGTGLVGAPACGDVMRLQVRIDPEYTMKTSSSKEYTLPLDLIIVDDKPVRFAVGDRLQCWQEAEQDSVTYVSDISDIIQDAKFKTFGCGSAIASSSLVTEWVKGKSVDYAESIQNSQIVEELSLPPVKVHCSVLAEDAVKAAIADWRKKKKDGIYESVKPESAENIKYGDG